MVFEWVLCLVANHQFIRLARTLWRICAWNAQGALQSDQVDRYEPLALFSSRISPRPDIEIYSLFLIS